MCRVETRRKNIGREMIMGSNEGEEEPREDVQW